MDKKHEDVGAVAQIDKTSVFQEGTATSYDSRRAAGVLWELTRTQREYSTRVPSHRGNAEWYVATGNLSRT
jgi:hypothetical protein